jgi:hypothetical protein
MLCALAGGTRLHLSGSSQACVVPEVAARIVVGIWLPRVMLVSRVRRKVRQALQVAELVLVVVTPCGTLPTGGRIL